MYFVPRHVQNTLIEKWKPSTGLDSMRGGGQCLTMILRNILCGCTTSSIVTPVLLRPLSVQSRGQCLKRVFNPLPTLVVAVQRLSVQNRSEAFELHLMVYSSSRPMCQHNSQCMKIAMEWTGIKRWSLDDPYLKNHAKSCFFLLQVRSSGFQYLGFWVSLPRCNKDLGMRSDYTFR